MDAARLLRHARTRRAWTLRGLARRAATSHSTLAAYEAGRVQPTVETLERILRAAGFTVVAGLQPVAAWEGERSRELLEVLELAAEFPSRFGRELDAPIFGTR